MNGEYLKIISLPLQEWPDDDRYKWSAAQKPGKHFLKGGAASKWRASTITNVEYGWGIYLAWLNQGGKLLAGTSLHARITEQLLSAFVCDYVPGRSEFSVAGQVSRLGFFIKACLPDHDFGWLSHFGYFMMGNARPQKVKLEKLQPAQDLLCLGKKLMASAKQLMKLKHRGPLRQYRKGLMIATLAAKPLRLGEFAAMKVGTNFVRSDKIWILTLAADKVKTNKQKTWYFPPFLTEAFDFYFATVRMKILEGTAHLAEDSVWVGSQGVLVNSSIHNIVVAETAKEFGIAVNPHLFRDCAATTIAIEAPHLVGITKSVLTHDSLVTSQKYYNQAQSIEASKKLNATIDKLCDV